MSEEVQDAAINFSRAMVASVTINGALRFGIPLALLFCDVSIDFIWNDQIPGHQDFGLGNAIDDCSDPLSHADGRTHIQHKS